MKIWKNKSWFTLLEMIVVITIIWILMISAYVPYSFYNKKAYLRVSKKEIAKILYESRNLAIHWNNYWSGNLSVWVFFDSSDINENIVRVFSYPFSYTWSQITTDLTDSNIKLIRELKLQPWIEIDKVSTYDNWFFYFNAISWKAEIYYFNSFLNKQEISGNKINIDLSFRDSENLKDSIEYLKTNNIVNY